MIQTGKGEKRRSIQRQLHMDSFNKGQDYSRSDIHAQVGGSIQSYLPDVNGKIVAGCFRLDTNPDAPKVILPGNGPQIKRVAKLLASGKYAIPVFIKQAVNQWRFVGNFRVNRICDDPVEIRKQSQRSGRSDISGILYLSEVV